MAILRMTEIKGTLFRTSSLHNQKVNSRSQQQMYKFQKIQRKESLIAKCQSGASGFWPLAEECPKPMDNTYKLPLKHSSEPNY